MDIDNSYSLSCLFGILNDGYWALLQELVQHGIEKAASLSARIMDCALKHMDTRDIILFVTENAPIQIVRKHQKQLSESNPDVYRALALRLGGDKEFVIEKARLYNLVYFDICAKFNIATTDEEAIEDLKLYITHHGHDILCDVTDYQYILGNIRFSLRLNSEIDHWRNAIEELGLNRAVEVFDQ